ncbi:hypothetical protein N7510_008418 [Penicillium lagena]|uniref:uncharacterized protein n=1 Tax=Penicillium lagena TaxID=94218 RepID=UPI0025417F17|nr:uncharacterized protein N7510_008418 [Penicillium lagena]KAJ5605637.1 hypothetical protein N7510_008418 [Penicillium lagena]
MAATVPPADDDPGKLDPIYSDQDAEGEEETDLYQMDQQLQDAVHRAYTGEVAEENGDDEVGGETKESASSVENADSDVVGAVKIRDEDTSYHSEDADAEADADPAFEDRSDHGSNSDPSDQESDVEEDWDAESNDRDEADGDTRSRANCIFCNQDEEHDPSEDYEEYLTCAVCGDHSHRQCAREQDAFHDKEDPWKCPTCVYNKLEPDPVVTQHKAPSLPKELLPAHSGAKGPGFHSIFDAPDVNDGLLNSSRSLRKRKASSLEVEEEHAPVLRKRRRQSSLRADHPDLLDPVLAEGEEIADADADTLSPAAIRPVRSRRTRGADRETFRVVSQQIGKLVVGFRLDHNKVSKVLSAPSRPLRKKKKNPKPPPVIGSQAHFAAIPPTPYAPVFTPFHDREIDDSKSKPYGGILSEAEQDTSKTLPTQLDRERFEIARQKAEEEWQRKVREAELNGEATPTASAKVSGPPSKIKYINFGGFEIETWYAAPYPEEYSRNRVLYICEFCLKYMNSDYVAWRHKLKCPAKNPPGDEIYRDGSISIFEVDGRKNPVYCQNLCLLAKLFLGSKTLYYDVEPFLFYVMTEYDDLGCHFVGYFSKEKRPSSANNVSCILTLPIHQRKGYGNLLIDFSYLLTRIEGKNGSPEKPLSDMGLVSYRNYWRLILSYQLRDLKSPVSIADLSDRTGMTADDLVSALEGLRALVRDPITKTYAFRLDHKYFQEVIDGWESKGYVTLNPDALLWTPYIMGRSNQSQFDRAPMHTVAPREDPDEEEEEEETEINGDSVSMVNGTNGTGFAEPAGPPSTTAFDQADGLHKSSSPDSSEVLSNPANGIPPSRFELWPPVQAPPPAKRKPGRPFGSFKKNRHSMTPTTNRISGRNTPRRASQLPMGTPTSTGMRRGRRALLMDSPSGEATPTQVNGIEAEEAGLEEAVVDSNAEELVDGTSDADGQALEDISGADDADDEPAETNGHIEEDMEEEEEDEVSQTPSKPTSRSPQTPTRNGSKGEPTEHTPRLSRSVNRKALVEKIQVMVPATEHSATPATKANPTARWQTRMALTLMQMRMPMQRPTPTSMWMRMS